MTTSFLHFARVAIIILICGLGVAGTSRGMHNESVDPAYAKLAKIAANSVSTIKHTEAVIMLEGILHVGTIK